MRKKYRNTMLSYSLVVLAWWSLVDVVIGQQGSNATVSPMSAIRLVDYYTDHLVQAPYQPYNESSPVEIERIGEWGTIFIQPSRISNSKNIARVICRQAGIGEPSFLTILDYKNVALVDSQLVAFQIHSCRGDEVRIQDCQYSLLPDWLRRDLNYAHRYRDEYGTYPTYVGVICNATQTEIPSFRLVDGPSASEGTAEVFFKGERGFICANISHSDVYGHVICHELGYSSGSYSNTSPRNSNWAMLEIWHCNDDAISLQDCEYSPWWQHFDSPESCSRYGSWLSVTCQGIRIRCPSTSFIVGIDGKLLILNPMKTFDIGLEATAIGLITYTYIGRTIARPANATNHVLTGFPEGTSVSEVMITDNVERVSCAFRAVRSVSEHLQLRLVEGSRPSEGLVEIQFNGEWGKMCSETPNQDHGEIICRQLGYHTETSHSYMVSPQLFGTELNADVGRVWIMVERCDANEKFIQNCQLTSLWGASSCPLYSVTLAVVCNDNAPVPRPVRLVGSSLPSEGRLEILGFNGQWARACTNPENQYWDWKSAEVACRQLGFTNWAHHLTSGIFGEGSGPILLTGVDCNGTENDLESCGHSIWGYKQRVWTDVVNRCFDICLACDVASPVSLRLVGGSAPTEGILQVHFNGLAGNICNKSWDHNDTLVACRQLGFTDGFSYAAPSQMFNNEIKAWSYWLENVECHGDEMSIQDCSHSTWGAQVDGECQESSEAAVAVFCNEPLPEVKLIGGKSPYEGVVQVKFRGEWGTVCSQSEGRFNWTDSEAKVVCRQLGYNGWAFAVSSHLFERGLRNEKHFTSEETSRLWLKNILCKGDEGALVLCQHTPWVEEQHCYSEEGNGGFASVLCVEDRFGDLPASKSDITPEIGDGIALGIVSLPNLSMATSTIILLVIICVQSVLMIVVIALLAMVLINRRTSFSYIAAGQADQDVDVDHGQGEPSGESRL